VRRALLVAGALGALVAAGCGGGDEAARTTATAPPAATPTAPATATETAPAPTATTTTPAEPTATTGVPTSPEEQEGGAGDEEAARVPAAFELTIDGPRPLKVELPAFLAIELVGISRDGRDHTITFRDTTLNVPAGGRASARIAGLRPGTYPVDVDGDATAASIVTGAEAGP